MAHETAPSLERYPLYLTNTLTRRRERFEPLTPGFVGMYVCGPTVYGEPHLGHARPYTTFDVLMRYLQHLGLRVRYVRNITDVGHLTDDADAGEDKIAKKARLEQLEPMEVAQLYTNSFRQQMLALGNIPPHIEPQATGHITEQIALVQKILDAGYGYVAAGSVYFDVPKYAQDFNYGELSGRTELEDMIAGSRSNLEGQSVKRHPADFALWKKAEPEHIMRWPSPWGEGFPGWHLECTAMSTKYLGAPYDIHGGGMDLTFPHHEAEIAQCNAACCKPGEAPLNEARYWLHNNMITIDGQKMGKSLGNFITLEELFTGQHAKLEQAYSPMTVRFFILQSHYRSTLDFSNDALQGAEKALKRLLAGLDRLSEVQGKQTSSVDVDAVEAALYGALSDDLNTARVVATLFDQLSVINALITGEASLSLADAERYKGLLTTFAYDILGLQAEAKQDDGTLDKVLQLMIEMRAQARANKDFAQADAIRDRLAEAGIELLDGKEGTSWRLK